VGCSDLLAADKGGTSDPYVTVNLLEKGSGKQIKKESFKSKTVKKTLSPVFDQTHEFGGVFDLDVPTSQLPSIEFKVYDADNFSSEPLGFATVSLADFAEQLEAKLYKRTLEVFGKMKKVSGEIEFTAHFNRLETKEVALTEEIEPDKSKNPLVIPPGVLEAEGDPNELHVLVLQAKGLKIMDTSMFSKGGSSDPLCTVSVGTSAKSTKVIKKTLDPEWNEGFVLQHSNPGSLLKIQIDDYDMASGNDFIGQVTLPMSSLSDKQENREWRTLQTLEGEESAKLGKVLIAFRWLYNPSLKAVPEVAVAPPENVKLQELSEEDIALKNSFQPLMVAEDARIDAKDQNELHILVIKAKYIQAMDTSMLGSLPSISLPGMGKKKEKKEKKKPAGTSDPFVEVKTSTKTKATYKTEVIKKTLEPVWEQNTFAIPESDPGGDVTLELRDSDMLKSEFMGKIVVPMSRFKERTEIREWYDLRSKDGIVDKDRGKLLVAFKWVYNPSILSEAEAMDPNDMGPPMVVKPADVELKPANRVHVFVIRARKLQVMDKNMFSSGGSSDPVVKLRYDKEVLKSKVVKKTLNPVWMERFHFDRVLSTISKNTVEIIVEDYDLNGNDFMGKVNIPLVSLKDRKELRMWQKLENEKGTNDGKERGELLVALRWVYDPKAKPPKVPGALDDLEKQETKPRRISTVPKNLPKKKPKIVDEYKEPEPRLIGTFGNWQELEEPYTKAIYWYNTVTRVSTWEEPGWVKEEKHRLMIARVKAHTEKSLWDCDDSAYRNFRNQVIDERNRSFRWLSALGKEELHRHRMERFMVFLLDQEKKELSKAFRPWKELIVRQEQHEAEGAALEIQRVIRAFLVRRREARTERGMRVHYIKAKVLKFCFEHKEKMEMIARGDGFALVGQMTLDKVEEETLEEIFVEMSSIAVEEIAQEIEVYEMEAERLRREAALDDALDAAFASDEESDEEEEEDAVEGEESIPMLDDDGNPIPKPKKKKQKQKPLSALDLAIQRKKQEELVKRGLADPDTLKRSLNDHDISVAAEKIEDNILENALDGIIEEVESYLGPAFSLKGPHRDAVLEDCIRLWSGDETLTVLNYDSKRKPLDPQEEGDAGLVGEAGEGDVDDADSLVSSVESSTRFYDEDDSSDDDLEELDVGFGDAGAIAIAQAMRENPHITKISIRNHAIGDEGMTALARALARNRKITSLDLSRNSICNLGAQELARMLCYNDTLVHVNLKNNLIGDFGTRKLLMSLRKNTRVAGRKLMLKNNRVSIKQTFQAREVKLKLGFSQQRTKINSAPMKITHR